MGTPVATNALLERKGACTPLAITRGFADRRRQLSDDGRSDLVNILSS
jgi:N-methylhydantoinase A/oxoprolinase/acetone carboxylase beta subunit